MKHNDDNLWHDILDSLGGAVMALDSRMSPVFANAAAETILGVSQISHQLMEDLVRDNEWLGRMLQSCLKTGQEVSDPRATLNTGTRQVSVRAEVGPLLHASGWTGGIIILLHDLSHQKSATQAIDDDTGLRLSPVGLAHEVRNPLTGIRGAAELMSAMLPGEPRAQEYCELILSGVDRIAALVEQVLEVGSPQRLARNPVNIHRVLHQALRMAGLHPNAPAGMIVEQEFDPSLPEVMGDEGALGRVFINLIRNAVEAMDAQGMIRIRTRMENEFRLAADGKHVHFLRVAISDSGPGVSDEQMRQLFAPFFTTKPSGTGLGLVLSQRIIALHGGKLWAERGGVNPKRTKGKARGMTFKITLPTTA